MVLSAYDTLPKSYLDNLNEEQKNEIKRQSNEIGNRDSNTRSNNINNEWKMFRPGGTISGTITL